MEITIHLNLASQFHHSSHLTMEPNVWSIFLDSKKRKLNQRTPDLTSRKTASNAAVSKTINSPVQNVTRNIYSALAKHFTCSKCEQKNSVWNEQNLSFLENVTTILEHYLPVRNVKRNFYSERAKPFTMYKI